MEVSEENELSGGCDSEDVKDIDEPAKYPTDVTYMGSSFLCLTGCRFAVNKGKGASTGKSTGCGTHIRVLVGSPTRSVWWSGGGAAKEGLFRREGQHLAKAEFVVCIQQVLCMGHAGVVRDVLDSPSDTNACPKFPMHLGTPALDPCESRYPTGVAYLGSSCLTECRSAVE
ncbi:hypothetical protein Scep_016209 [Stephania cephalantha]|uniref:Uncharacterized protein n=1 Tax=Stephania cephalantha TaxID=152367 RepID=A0AAP0IM75_9MAGN